MNHIGDADELAAPGAIDFFKEKIIAGVGVVGAAGGGEGDEGALLQVFENLAGVVLGEKEESGEVRDGQRFGPVVPHEKERFKVRDAVDFIKDEAVDFRSARILFAGGGHGDR
jgi:hypothetical protein